MLLFVFILSYPWVVNKNLLTEHRWDSFQNKYRGVKVDCKRKKIHLDKSSNNYTSPAKLFREGLGLAFSPG